MSNCNLFEINIFINVIKHRCDNKNEIKEDEAEEENGKKKQSERHTKTDVTENRWNGFSGR